jgi:hypothetical protein
MTMYAGVGISTFDCLQSARMRSEKMTRDLPTASVLMLILEAS